MLFSEFNVQFDGANTYWPAIATIAASAAATATYTTAGLPTAVYAG